MFAFRSRVTAIAAGLVFFAITPAHAQVTIQLTTTQQTACTVVTDAHGLTLVPGGTNLQATGVTLSGPGCGGAGGGTPPSPPNFLLTLPVTGNVGTSFQVSWSVTNATSCTGSADLGGSSASLPGWTDVSTATSPRQVTANAPGAYTLRLTCSNAAGSVTSTPGVIAITQTGGDTCPSTPLTRMAVGTIRYPNWGNGTGTRTNVDLTQFDNIWGHLNNVDSITPWPGVSGTQPAIMNWNRSQYAAAKFHVPANQSIHQYGNFGYGTYYSGPSMTLAISQTCGDFSPTNPVCVSTHGAGESFRKWVINPFTNGCPLTPNTDYYVNIKMADPNTTECGSDGVCTGIAINNTLSTQ